MSALHQPSACYLFPALIWILSLPFRQLDLFVYIVTLVWSSMMLLMSMVYQLNFVHDSFNKTLLNQNATKCSATYNNAADALEWFGFEKVQEGESFCYFVRGWLAIIITLLAERVIFRRSRYLENMYPESKSAPGAVFPDIIRPNADESVKSCAQFFANYFFHKFGVEICFISTVLTVWKRQDFFGSVYAILLLILLIVSFKRGVEKQTRFFTLIWERDFQLNFFQNFFSKIQPVTSLVIRSQDFGSLTRCSSHVFGPLSTFLYSVCPKRSASIGPKNGTNGWVAFLPTKQL